MVDEIKYYKDPNEGLPLSEIQAKPQKGSCKPKLKAIGLIVTLALSLGGIAAGLLCKYGIIPVGKLPVRAVWIGAVSKGSVGAAAAGVSLVRLATKKEPVSKTEELFFYPE